MVVQPRARGVNVAVPGTPQLQAEVDVVVRHGEPLVEAADLPVLARLDHQARAGDRQVIRVELQRAVVARRVAGEKAVRVPGQP